MAQTRLDVLSCVEHERLTFELLEVRTRGQYLTRLRGISREEQAEWDRRGRAGPAALGDHQLDHRCGRFEPLQCGRRTKGNLTRKTMVIYRYRYVYRQVAADVAPPDR